MDGDGVLDAQMIARVRSELARLNDQPAFRRARVMQRLLGFLVEESIAGRGGQLKAYAVAVDGLGREADFDAQSDSYPRVQVGRLRRLLDAAYADGAAPLGIRLAIPLGGYRVLFERTEAVSGGGEATALPPPPVTRGRERWRGGIVLILLLALLGAIAWLTGERAPVATAQLAGPPILELGRIAASPSLRDAQVETEAVLLDALRRSWLVRLRGANGGDGREPARYRLAGSIMDGGSRLLRLELARLPGGDVIWTGRASLPPAWTGIEDAMAPLIAELVQPYGVIATDQRAGLTMPAAPGQPCRLLFDRYRGDRVVALYDATRACTAATLTIEPGNAAGLAMASVLMLDSMIYFDATARDRRARAFALARDAVAVDPYLPLGHMALARAALFLNACPTAVRASERAVALNSFDPDLLAMSALVLLNCGDPGAEALVRRAVTLDPDAPGWTWTVLLFVALDRGDHALALDAAANIPPGTGSTPALNDIAVAAAYAANGNGARAAAAWRRLAIASPSIARDPDLLLRQRLLPKRLRAKMLADLAAVGIMVADGAEQAAPVAR